MSLNLDHIRAAVAQHGPVVRVVIASVRGSAPREPGAAMLVWDGGQSGTIGGGRLEFEAAETARSAFGQPDRAETVALGPGLGQCCGGTVTLVTEVFDDARLATISGDHYLRRIEGTEAPPLAIRRALNRHRSGLGALAPVYAGGWYLEPVTGADREIWIYGAGHVGRALTALLAPMPEFRVTLVDTAANRFPAELPEDVRQLVAANPADAAGLAPAGAEHVVMTYSHALDLEICHRLLGRDFRSAGLIGSATKWARFRKRLRALGHSDAQIDRIRCPIGQPALGKHPQAIAVGVTAELLLAGTAATTVVGERVG